MYKKKKSNLISVQKWQEVNKFIYNKQFSLVTLAINGGVKSFILQFFQCKLITSLSFRLFSIKNIFIKKGTKVFKIDNLILGPTTKLIDIIEKLILIKTSKEFILKKKIYKKKNIVYLRFLQVFTLKDKICQLLFKLIVDPINEVLGDSHTGKQDIYSYQAIQLVKSALKNQFKSNCLWIMKIDTKVILKNILHFWIKKNLPIPIAYNYYLKSWLQNDYLVKKNNVINKGLLSFGFFSFTLLNFIFSGFHKTLKNGIKRIFILKKLNYKRFKIFYTYYFNTIVIFTMSKYFITSLILPIIFFFFREKSLFYLDDKINNFFFKQGCFNFLGYFFIKINKNSKLFLMSEKFRFKSIKIKIRKIFHFNIHKSVIEIILLVNAIILGWVQYYNQVRKDIRYLEQYIFYLCFNWARRKHIKWGKYFISYTYFLDYNNKFKNKLWSFKGSIYCCHFKIDKRKIYLMSSINIIQNFITKKQFMFTFVKTNKWFSFKFLVFLNNKYKYWIEKIIEQGI